MTAVMCPDEQGRACSRSAVSMPQPPLAAGPGHPDRSLIALIKRRASALPRATSDPFHP
jgi:hypothetical protein